MISNQGKTAGDDVNTSVLIKTITIICSSINEHFVASLMQCRSVGDWFGARRKPISKRTC